MREREDSNRTRAAEVLDEIQAIASSRFSFLLSNFTFLLFYRRSLHRLVRRQALIMRSLKLDRRFQDLGFVRSIEAQHHRARRRDRAVFAVHHVFDLHDK